MTLFGKILLYLNLVLSAFMAGYAFVLWVNYVDVSPTAPTAPKPGEVGGLLWQRIDRINALQPALTPPYKSWKQARTRLHVQEDLRQADVAWYRGEIKHLETGATEAEPCRSVVLVRNLPDPNPKNCNRPRLQPATDRAGQPLRSMKFYEETHKEKREALQVVEIASAEQQFKATELSARLEALSAKVKTEAETLIATLTKRIDEADKEGLKKQQEQLQKLKDNVEQLLANPPDRKGLRQRLIDEDAKRELVKSEVELVEPLWKVNEVDTELLLRRRETIVERLKELQDVLVKRYGAKVTLR